ncbi:hypothetical protein Pdw03_0257 [Penicillium digitatum]|uniref:Uncharacterized protein n=1 Tax=Penicillium digitatum TaxID=36651 RepID=A0A7T6XQ54_PENDI|nr:hypothetical protein Pdw03_0257 [Penicillium digitatum]
MQLEVLSYSLNREIDICNVTPCIKYKWEMRHLTNGCFATAPPRSFLTLNRTSRSGFRPRPGCVKIDLTKIRETEETEETEIPV